ncbi:hypothetical protein CH330_10035 [candidate division WOR-3 bacterium JGI_Cruoil_03_51_56]|uniref:Radical SAM core domain-containing protein n=1 Tax=candidate division WOR-3 bacterium JGI_Cruoil_03_51_56 TaxID=1973747 RepID=A0A235BN89_UNCW3|nr:MAG: hypothetical protein CH330_10035 [candidate division WOR-3 bacterium JGI_Cruoil_03_51_56]
MNLDKMFQQGSYRLLLETLAKHRNLRKVMIPFIEKKMYPSVINSDTTGPRQVQEDKYAAAVAMLHSTVRSVDRGIVSKHVLDRMFDVYLDNLMMADRGKLSETWGYDPPSFLVVSPGKLCNLHCTGCYACSDSSAAAKLDFDTFDRILTEKEKLWGSYFTVISGGEPFLWKDNGKDLIDIAAKHSSNFFEVFTNGTLINEETAKRLEQIGNLTPAISVEGFEAETDQRRGKGVHRRILKAFENLRNAGVPFGISVTGTRNNWDIVTSDEFIDYYFNEQGVTYGWLFQYMPIGRKHTLDIMVTPEQRFEMLKRTFHIQRDLKAFIADFWNSGVLSDGCISSGRGGGYMYINWNGDVSPCVFVPYSTHNIIDVYRNGGDLNTVLDSPMMQKIREWQKSYGYLQPADKVNNWFCPCPIRDHHGELLKIIRECGAKGIDPEAEIALNETEYHEGLIQYGKDFDRLSRPLWEEKYVPRKANETRKLEPVK